MKPNFLIIGAAKAGTTSLYDYLGQHPDIFMCPLKEPKFFALEGHNLDFSGPGDQRANRHTITDWHSYEQLFAHTPTKRAIGEKSPIYLYDPEAPKRIKSYLPDIKIIAILRNPIERAYSNYLHMVRDSREDSHTFLDALFAEDDRIRNNWAYGWHYRSMGYYAEQIQRYLELFDSKQIKVYLYEDLRTKPQEMMYSLFDYLEVDPTFQPDMRLRENKTGLPKNPRLQLFLKYEHPLKSMAKPFLPTKLRQRMRVNIINRNLEKAPPIDATAKAFLHDAFATDIMQLEDIIQRDLSAWRQ